MKNNVLQPGAPIDVDNDPRYTNPRAWRNAKRAWFDKSGKSGGYPGRAMVALEGFCKERDICPRMALAAALHAYMILSDEARRAATLWMYEADDDIARPLPREVQTDAGTFAVELSPFMANGKHRGGVLVLWAERRIIIGRAIASSARPGWLTAAIAKVNKLAAEHPDYRAA
jgi:hypothetical protein